MKHSDQRQERSLYDLSNVCILQDWLADYGGKINWLLSSHYASQCKCRIWLHWCVVSGVITKRSLVSNVCGVDISFQNNFRICWNFQIYCLALYSLDSLLPCYSCKEVLV